jgi:hypothetical protein
MLYTFGLSHLEGMVCLPNIFLAASMCCAVHAIHAGSDAQLLYSIINVRKTINTTIVLFVFCNMFRMYRVILMLKMLVKTHKYTYAYRLYVHN